MKWFRGKDKGVSCCASNSHGIEIDRKKYRYCSVCGKVWDSYGRLQNAEVSTYVLSVVGGAFEIPMWMVFDSGCDKYREKDEYDAMKCDFSVNWNGVIYPVGSWLLRRVHGGEYSMVFDWRFSSGFEKVNNVAVGAE